MSDLKVGRLTGCRGNKAAGTIIVDLQLEDGSTISVHLDAPVATALVPTLHQVTRQVVAALGQDPEAAAMEHKFPVQSARFGHNAAAKVGALVIDHGLPSQVTYLLNEDQTWNLAAGITDAIQVFKLTQGRGTLN